jgi:hypothetical protein
LSAHHASCLVCLHHSSRLRVATTSDGDHAAANIKVSARLKTRLKTGWATSYRSRIISAPRFKIDMPEHCSASLQSPCSLHVSHPVFLTVRVSVSRSDRVGTTSSAPSGTASDATGGPCRRDHIGKHCTPPSMTRSCRCLHSMQSRSSYDAIVPHELLQ